MRSVPPTRLGALAALCALLLLPLAGCANESRFPFLSAAPPKETAPPLEYPLLFPAPRDVEKQPPVLTEDEQKAMEEQLKNLANTRERAVRRRIERSQ